MATIKRPNTATRLVAVLGLFIVTIVLQTDKYTDPLVVFYRTTKQNTVIIPKDIVSHH